MADDPAPPDDLAEELRRISHEFHELHRDIHRMVEAAITNNLPLEALTIMAALDDLKALGTRIDAVTAALPADVATAVKAQADADAAAIKTAQDALAAAQAAATQAESDLAAEVTDLTAKVAALEAAAGIATPPTGLTVSPSTVSIALASTTAIPVTITGQTGAVTASGLPSGVTFDSANQLVPDGTQVTGTSTITFTDSSTPTALTGSLTLTVAA